MDYCKNNVKEGIGYVKHVPATIAKPVRNLYFCFSTRFIAVELQNKIENNITVFEKAHIIKRRVVIFLPHKGKD